MSLLNFKIRWNQPMTRINFANICIIRKNFVPSWENMREGERRGDTKTLVELRSVSVYDQSVELVQEKGRRSLTCSILGYWCNWKSVNKNMIGFSNQLGSPSVKLFFKTFFPPYLAGLKCRTNIFQYSDLWPLYFNNVWATISTQTFLQLLFAFSGCSGQFLQFSLV